jgi:hypothetical protein
MVQVQKEAAAIRATKSGRTNSAIQTHGPVGLT